MPAQCSNLRFSIDTIDVRCLRFEENSLFLSLHIHCRLCATFFFATQIPFSKSNLHTCSLDVWAPKGKCARVLPSSAIHQRHIYVSIGFSFFFWSRFFFSHCIVYCQMKLSYVQWLKWYQRHHSATIILHRKSEAQSSISNF